MTLKNGDAKQSIEKLKEYIGRLAKNTTRDFNKIFSIIQEYPLISISFIFAVIFLFVFPYLQVDLRGINNVTIEAELENQYRATLAQILGGVAIAIGLYYTWRRIGIAEKELQATQTTLKVAQDNLKVTQDNLKVTQEIAENNLKVSKEGQITERFTHAVDQLGAIDQLGKVAMEIRLGGIYALERISKESENDYWPIMEILTAYVRKNSSSDIVENKKVTQISMDIQANESKKSEFPKARKISLDIQAVLTVIGKRLHSFNNGESTRLNLGMTHLEGANLQEAHLEGADLSWAHLEVADLQEAHLEGAFLSWAHLEVAYLKEAHLEEASLTKAHLEGAYLIGAHLEGAYLKEAHLEGADLQEAHLEGADLSWAHLEGAYLREAHLEGADFNIAHLEGAELKDAHFKGAKLIGVHLEGASLIKAHLEGAYLIEAHLEGAYLIGAHLEGAYLSGTHLEGADLQEAHLEKADLHEAFLIGASLIGAHLKGANNLSINQLLKAKTLYEAEFDEDLRRSFKEKYPKEYQVLIKNPNPYE
ncbi:pentapeptide repeat-containing protein [Methanosarcina sp. WH1]|uniref:pentapeptide repeat-containing protein n=1 Tax=Methanosarcina sp. WH1 TaxID=1434102 RepID=UPI000615B118|nr:pentapeptide repeat-containing protein [Methanosarcina sp. WH1]AKB22311.1 Pentapeptide repeat family protein [Methanosarcina sp. WH1]